MVVRSRKLFRFVTDERLSILQKHFGPQIDLQWLNVFVAGQVAVSWKLPSEPSVTGCQRTRWAERRKKFVLRLPMIYSTLGDARPGLGTVENEAVLLGAMLCLVCTPVSLWRRWLGSSTLLGVLWAGENKAPLVLQPLAWSLQPVWHKKSLLFVKHSSITIDIW